MPEDKRAKQSLILLAVCLVGFIGVEIGYGNWLRGISNDKNRRLELVGHIQSCMSALIDSESSCHTYLITHKREYLKPFDQALKNIDEQLQDIKPFCEFNDEKDHLRELRFLADAKVANCHELITIEDAKNASPELIESKVSAGIKAMDTYEGETKNFLVLEDSHIKPEQDIVNTGRDWLLFFRYFVLLMSVLAVVRMFALHRQQQQYLHAAIASRDEALVATRLKSEFASTMSHEIRTPLSAIVGFSEMMIEEPNVETADIIHSQSRKLLQIVNEILDFSKLEAGMSTYNKAPLSLKSLLDNIVRATSTAAEKNETSVSFVVLGDDTIIGDEVKLSQILLNFVSNAVKFSNKAPVTITATNNGSLKIDVVDHGIGIDDADLDKLFKPFSQLDNSNTRKYGGTGLGLSISKKLVELMGGKISCTSTKSNGSTFTFELPQA